MTLPKRLSRLSPFRWRLEWAVLVVAVTAGVLGEQAHEARQRDPYQIVQIGRSAQAIVSNARETVVHLGKRRGVPQQETHTLLDLEWQDGNGIARRIEGYRLDSQTVQALRIDLPAGQWPGSVRILYLDRPALAGSGQPSFTVVEQGVTATAFQQHCRPLQHCRVVVLPPTVLTPAEEAADNVDYVLERAPYAFHLSLVVLVLLLGLRLAGIIDNRPSLE